MTDISKDKKNPATGGNRPLSRDFVKYIRALWLRMLVRKTAQKLHLKTTTYKKKTTVYYEKGRG